ncbi:pilus assembly protein [Enterobacteriaceae bacterium Kacie_13]|nr:pilus assembly protein [Enterobacteriaceae bacterium Kacie_13]
MIKYLSDNNLLTGLIWEPENIGHMGRNYQVWINKIRRTHGQLVYTTQDGGLLKGYSERRSSDFEPFAIHVKNEYGDGVYFFNDGKDGEDVYYLIISNDRIISGSDKVVKKSFFDSLMLDIKESVYSGLEIKELKEQWIESIALVCHQRQSIIKRKQKLFVIGVAVVGIFLLVLMAILLNMMLS